MKKAFEVFNQELSSLRIGRANASMLDLIKVEVYGQTMPINQLATISTPEPRLLTVQVWDQNNVPLVDSAIQKSNFEKKIQHSTDKQIEELEKKLEEKEKEIMTI